MRFGLSDFINGFLFFPATDTTMKDDRSPEKKKN